MSRPYTILATLAILLLSVLPSPAQDYNLPPGKWWENERMVAFLELSEEQQASIKQLVYNHATRMVDHNAALEKAKLTLENQVEKQDIDPQAIRMSFAAFQDARRLLETERFEMLLSVRQVLNNQQWIKMRSLRERLDTIRQRRDGAGEPRPGGPGNQPPRSVPPHRGPRG